jgi:hypothetical protein
VFNSAPCRRLLAGATGYGRHTHNARLRYANGLSADDGSGSGDVGLNKLQNFPVRPAPKLSKQFLG